MSSSLSLLYLRKVGATLVILLSFCGQSYSGPLQPHTSYSNPEDLWGTWIYVTIFSVGVLITLIGVLFMCGAGGGCCGLKFEWFGGAPASEERQMSFQNPVDVEDGTMMMQLSRVDAANAPEVDPVVFEPLPSIEDLSPVNAFSVIKTAKRNVAFAELIEETKEVSKNCLGDAETVLHNLETKSIVPQANFEAAFGDDDDSSFSQISQRVQKKQVENLTNLGHLDSGDLLDEKEATPVNTPSEVNNDHEVKSPSSSTSTPSSNLTPNPPPNTPSYPSDSIFDVKPLVFDESKFPRYDQSLPETCCKEEVSVVSSQQPQHSIIPVSSKADNEKFVSEFKPMEVISVPDICLVPSTPGTTPNKTDIDINVIQPSPVPVPDVNADAVTPVEIPSQIRPVKFVFSPNVKSSNKVNNAAEKERRNTSTPISSPAYDADVTPPDGEVTDDIFETEINTTGPISPIKCDITRIPPGELVTTVLASTNTASDNNELFEHQDISMPKDQRSNINLPTNLFESCSLGDIMNNRIGSESIEPMTSSSTGIQKFLHSTGPRVPSRTFVIKAKNMSDGSDRHQHQIERNFQVLGQVSTGGPFSLTPRPTEGIGDNRAHESESDANCDGDEFWSSQIEQIRKSKSIQDLNQVSFTDDHGYEKERFVEDIDGVQDKLGLLVLTDPEDDTNSVHTIVPESSRDNSDEIGATITYANDSLDLGASTMNSSRGYVASESSCSQDTVEWDVNSSVDIEKAKLFVDKSMLDVSWAEPKTKESSEKDVLSFVPSKWNQTLTPVKPAMKSSAVGPLDVQRNKNEEGMKKTVSFDGNNHSVYKYSPPDPVSDSDGDEGPNIKPPQSGTSPTSSSRNVVPMFPSEAFSDWDLNQEELEANEMNNDESDEEDLPKTETADPMNMYRISGFSDLNDETSFHVRGSDEPFSFPPPVVPSTLGELKQTKDRLRLDLKCKGEASLLDKDGSGESKDRSAKNRLVEVQTPPPKQLNIGVPASPNMVSPFWTARTAPSTNIPSTSHENDTVTDANPPRSDADVKDAINLMDW